MTVTPMPTDLSHGKVIGRFIVSTADSDDPDQYPDGRPATGQIVFTPAVSIVKANVPVPTTVLQGPRRSQFDDQGWVIDNPGSDGVWLTVGFWKVVYTITGFSISSHLIEVKATHTDGAPLDLFANQVPSGPPITASQYQELSNRLHDIEFNGNVPHAITHSTAGSDRVTPSSIGAASTPIILNAGQTEADVPNGTPNGTLIFRRQE